MQEACGDMTTAEAAFTNSPINKFNVECLEKILNFTNESITLYQCILANRLWCHIAIPLKTYLNCLPDNEKHIAMTKWKRYHWKTVWKRLGHFDLDKTIGDILFRKCNGLDSLYIIFFAYIQNIAYFEEPSNTLTRLQTCKIIHDL
ncbi:16743_t:CDS:2 [Funneliformis caledonium]|uniref:16743_t:CDS:1 n=1 Tax=Funneliformis caledonium TaxID=1117310 RepID=A0A9N9CQ28_9GLOM|nr:16743_t:CDS:2 [Funneliformis caledonium]